MDLGENQNPQENYGLKPFSKEKFYGKHKEHVGRRQYPNFTHPLSVGLPPLPRRLSSLMGPSRTWKIFKRQKEGLECAKTCGNGLMTFAFQQKSGQRLFLVAHPAIFWHYDCYRDMNTRCSYEIIPESTPCKIYFDLEYDRSLNDKSDSKRMVKTFIKVVTNHLHAHFHRDITQSQVLILDASTNVKFSHHLIFQGLYFKDNGHLGRFVKELCRNIRTGIKEEKFFIENCGLFANIAYSEICELLVIDRKKEERLFCDEAVYTKNRHFRLYCSTKLGKSAPLLLGSLNEYLPAKDVSSKEQLFLDSLVTFIESNNLDWIEFDKIQEFESPKKAMIKDSCVTRKSPDDDVDFVGLDKFVRGLISAEGWIRRRTLLKEKNGNRVLFDIQGDRYCANIRRQHRSNNVYIVVDGSRGTWYQKCYDPDCRGFKSTETALPPEINFLVESDELDLNQEYVSDMWDDSDTEIVVDFGSFEIGELSDCLPSEEERALIQKENREDSDFPDYGMSDEELIEAANY